MAMIVREARPEDAEQLIARVHRLVEEPQIDIPMAPGEFKISVEEERVILQEYADQDNSVFLIAEVEGRIIGSLNCRGGDRMATRHVAHLGMAVDREWRNQGVGTALLARALEWGRKSSSIKRIELAVYVRNRHAIHLYEKFGFAIEGRRRNVVFQNGEYLDDFMMAVVL